MTTKSWMLLIAVVSAGLFLRGRELTRTALWADEAESSLNALTILEHGYPTSEYLGQPLFENVLHVEWPESEEYEFRDASYSPDGIACYHGWLPLYAIALSMRAFGVGPDTVTPEPTLQRGMAEMQRRTWVPRVPALLFSAAFLLVLFFALREMAGEEAAWAGVVFAALHGRCIDFGWQARYYAPTLLFCVAGGWAVWRTIERARARDAILSGLVLVCLFHTHVLSCLALCISLAVCGLVRRGFRDALRLSSITAIVVGLGSLPWMLGSGFFEVQGQPSIWDLLHGDLRMWELRIIGPAYIGALVVAVLARRFTFAQHGTTWWLVATWSSAALVGFVVLMPAATFFIDRVELVLMPAYLIAVSMLAGTVARGIARRWLAGRGSAVLATGLLLVFLVGTRQDRQGWWRHQPRAYTTYALAERIGGIVRPGMRVFATPSRHLALAYYTGIAVQSVAPVRTSWLEAYPGPILLVAEKTFGDPPSWREIQTMAADKGLELTREEAVERAHFFWGWWVRMGLIESVADTVPSSLHVVPWERPLIEQARRRMDGARDFYDWRWRNSLLFREIYTWRSLPNLIHDKTTFWQNYFYRFVDVRERSGENANYAGLLGRSTAEVRPELGCVLFHIPAHQR